MKLRLFAAIPLSDPLRSELAAVGREIAARLPDVPVRPTPEANLHCTVRFYGKVDAAPVREALEAALPLPPSSQRLRVARYASFPSPGRTRGIFAALDGGGTLLGALRRVCEAGARAAGLPPESRPFRPHVTVARFGRPARLPEGFLAGLPAFSLEFSVERLELLRSVLAAQGAAYTLVRAFPVSSRKSASRSGPSRA